MDEYITIDEACAILGVSRATLHNYFKQGKVQKYNKGITRRVLYKRTEIERLAEIKPAEKEHQED